MSTRLMLEASRRRRAVVVALLLSVIATATPAAYGAPDGKSTSRGSAQARAVPGSGGSDAYEVKDHAPADVPGAVPTHYPDPIAAGRSSANTPPGEAGPAQTVVRSEAKPKGFDRATSHELIERRTETSKTYINADGTLTTAVHPNAIHRQDAAGEWFELNADLRAKGTRLVPKALPMVVDFAADAADRRLVSADLGASRTIGWSLDGAKHSRASVSGSTATYRSVLPDVDMELRASAQGVKETLVLHSPNVPDSYVFPLDLTGLSATLGTDGSVALTSRGGEPVAMIPAGYMEDSALSPAAGVGVVSHDVRYELRSRGTGTDLVVHLDRAWLNNPGRVYPVRVDPSLTSPYPAADDTYVVSGPAGAQNYSTETTLRIGRFWNGSADV